VLTSCTKWSPAAAVLGSLCSSSELLDVLNSAHLRYSGTGARPFFPVACARTCVLCESRAVRAAAALTASVRLQVSVALQSSAVAACMRRYMTFRPSQRQALTRNAELQARVLKP
jgi:hypothetical protein